MKKIKGGRGYRDNYRGNSESLEKGYREDFEIKKAIGEI